MPGRRYLALIALLGCVVSGCSEADSDPPAVQPSAQSGSASPTAKADSTDHTVDVPTMPRRATKKTLKGAEAFVRHYIDLLNYAANTGGVDALQDAARDCNGCTIYEDLYRTTYAQGGYIHTPGWRPTDVQAFNQRSEIVVLVTIDAPRTRFKKSRTGETFIGRGGTHKLRFEVMPRRPSGWVVTYFGVQDDLPIDR